MKIALASIFLLAAAIALTGADALPDSNYADHDKVAKGGNFITRPDLTVLVNRRKEPGQVEVHYKETDVIYMLEGETTFITGGKMIGGKQSRANQWLGTDIQGGETHHLTKGDVIVVTAGVPHWFKEMPGPITYYVVKVLKP